MGLGVLCLCLCMWTYGNGRKLFYRDLQEILPTGANLPIYFQRISSVKELFKGKGVEKVNDTPYYFILIVHVG